MIINYSDQEVLKGTKSIFLAGPTPRDKEITSWRNEACKILEKLKIVKNKKRKFERLLRP